MGWPHKPEHRLKERTLKIHPLTLALALIGCDIVVVALALAAGFHPGPPVLILNVVALIAVFFLLARSRIRFRD